VSVLLDIFFQLQKTKAQKCQISSVYDSNGVEVFSQDEIKKAHFDFYWGLSSEEPIDLNFQNDLLCSLPRHLSNYQASLCEGAMTLGEISFAVILNMNTNESRGPDGLTVKFFS